jgi:WD40 repeat protein
MLKFNPNNNRQLVSIGYDGSVRVWNVETMQMTYVFEDKTTKNEKDQKINAVAW